MGLKQVLEDNADTILSTAFDKRDGRVVPETEKVKFIHEAVEMDATFLYSDLADSTELAKRKREAAANVFQTFLSCTSRVIRDEDGAIRSFDGDRVMGIFAGDNQQIRAVRCALKINWAFAKIVVPKLKAKYPKSLEGYELNYGSGIDTGTIWAVRGGVPNNSDLVWIGRAPNLAAKLSSKRSGAYRTRITQTVYNKLDSNTKFSNNTNMWEVQEWKEQGINYYRSSYNWRID
jgi:adenylate cyclase